MRDLAILTFLTLDGVMQGPTSPDEDPSNGFTQGGWAAPYYNEVMAQVREHAMAAPYDMLFGHKTYRMFAGHWPNAETTDPVAQMMNAARKYVATSSAEPLTWNNSKALTGDIPAEVARLKEQDGPLLQIHGSGRLIRTLLAHGLIDEFRLWTFPVILGAGTRLFGPETAPTTLDPVRTASCANGAVMSIYRSRPTSPT